MTGGPLRIVPTPWIVLGAFIAAALFATHRLVTDVPPVARTEFATSPTWLVLGPIATGFVFGIAIWNLLRDDRVVAESLAALATAVALYSFGSTVAIWLADVAHATGPLLDTAYAVHVGGWMAVLAVVQACVVVAARQRLADAVPGLIRFIIGAAAIAVALTILLPPAPALERFPGVTTVVPRDVISHPVLVGVSNIVFVAWVVSLFVPPISLWLAAREARGVRRYLLVRVAIGSVMPVLVVMLCGVLALAYLFGTGSKGDFDILSIGFAVSLPLTALWLSTTVNEPKQIRQRRNIAVSSAIRLVLWLLYAMVLIHVAGPITGLLGGGMMTAVVVTATTGTVSAPLWHRVVEWLVAGIATPWRLLRSGTLHRRQVAAGGAAMDGLVTDPALTGVRGDVAQLSPREVEVLAELACGKSNAAIAATLFLSERTIDAHLRSIFVKLDLSPSADANRRVQAALAWLDADGAIERQGA